MARTHKQRARDNELVERALLGELLPAEARDPGARRIHCKVAGVTHSNPDGSSRQKAIEQMAQFDFVHLVRNPADDHDANAIKVCVQHPAEGGRIHGGGRQIGHIPSELAAELAPLLDAGERWEAIATRVGGSYTQGVSLMLYNLRSCEASELRSLERQAARRAAREIEYWKRERDRPPLIQLLGFPRFLFLVLLLPSLHPITRW